MTVCWLSLTIKNKPLFSKLQNALACKDRKRLRRPLTYFHLSNREEFDVYNSILFLAKSPQS